MPEQREGRNENYQQHELLEVAADQRNAAEPVAQDSHGEDPAGAAKDVEGQKARIAHVGDSGDKGREGADNGNELGVDDGLAAVPLVEMLRSLQIFLLEETGIGPVEDGGAGTASDEVAGPIAQHASGEQHRHDQPDVELARARYHADSEQQRIARQHKADQQPCLRENNSSQHGIAIPARDHGGQQMDETLRRGERTQKIDYGAHASYAGTVASIFSPRLRVS